MKKTILTILSVALLTCANIASAVTVTTFGDSSAPVFTVDTVNTIFSYSQLGNQITITGSDAGGTLIGTFDSINLTGLTVLTLTGYVSGTNPNSAFDFMIYSSPADYLVYGSSTNLWASTSTAVELVYASSVGAFDANAVIALGFNANGGGSNLNMTLTSLTATAPVPEPTSMLLMFGGLAGMALVRRRRA